MLMEEPELSPEPQGCAWCHGDGREPCSDTCEERYYEWEAARRVQAMGEAVS